MDIGFNLRERTVLIAGPFSSTVQSLTMSLAQMGADVAVVDKNITVATRYCSQVTDQREVNSKFGRAFAFEADLTQPKAVKDVVGRVAQSYGSVDILIDAHMINEPTPFEETEIDKLDELYAYSLKPAIQLTQASLGFMKNRKRGRIIYLMNDALLKGNPQDVLQTAVRTGLVSYSQSLSRALTEFNITVNCLSLGLTEEFILGHYPGEGTIKEVTQKLKEKDPTLKITEADKVTQGIIFIASQMGVAITGQVITMT